MKTIIFGQGEFPGTRLKGKERYKTLYHFTSYETFKHIWHSKSLKFGDLTSVNDILEFDYSITPGNPQQFPLAFAFDELRKTYKQISLTMNKDSYLKGAMSTLMWGIYGDKRKGVSIELDFDNIKFPKTVLKGVVQYQKYISCNIELDTNLRSVNDIRKFIIAHKKDLFFTKTQEWAGEREYRIVSNSDEFLDISDAITAVVITDFNLPTFNELVDLIDNKVPIKVLRHNKNSNLKIVIPVLSDALACKKQEVDAMNNPENALLNISRQAKEHYDSLKNNPDADLIKIEYVL
jgi:hypothetical protein